MRTALALGFFDGVHIAHQKIISAAVDYAREHGLRAAALTFDRPPASVLFGAKERLLTDDAEKRRLIEGLGAERRILAATPALLSMSGASFVELLVREHSAAALFCGYNYTFGSDRLGAEELARLWRRKDWTIGRFWNIIIVSASTVVSCDLHGVSWHPEYDRGKRAWV